MHMILGYARQILLLLLLSTYALCAHGQIQGVVLDASDRSPIAVVMVKAVRDGKTIDFGTTDSKGVFRLRKAKVPVTLTFKHLSYAPISMEATDPKGGEYLLEPSTTELKDVTVHAPRVILKGDTTAYLLNQYTSQKDVTVEDALKKVPGITVSDGGTISYMGKNIDKLKIDGKELLGKDYEIATRNLKHNAVTRVEIMERQQEVKALKGLVSDDKLVMNLVLNKNARYKLNGNAEIGVGGEKSGTDYTCGTTLLHFMSRMQTVASGQYQHRFSSFVEEKRLLFGDVASSSSPVGSLLSSGLGASVPEVSDQYFRFKSGGKGTLNTTYDVGRDRSLRLNASMEDYSYRHTYGHDLTYMAPDASDVRISEDEVEASMSDREGRVTLTYTSNRDEAYLTNKLSYIGREKEGSDTFRRGDMHLSQYLTQSHHRLHNRLYSTFRVGSRLIGVSCDLSAERAPRMDMYADSYHQHLQEQLLSGNLSFSYRHLFGKGWSLNSALKYSGSNDELNMPQDRGVVGVRHTIEYSPSLSFMDSGTEITINTPLKYSHIKYHPSGYDDYLRGIWTVDPEVRLSYIITPVWKVYVSGTHSHSLGDVTDFIRDPLRLNYRTAYVGSGKLTEGDLTTLNFSLYYRKPLRELFANFFVRASRYHQNMITQDFPSKEVNLMSKIMMPNSGYNVNVSANVSKSFRYMQTKIDGSVSASQNAGTIVREGMDSHLVGQNLHGNVSLSMVPLSMIEVKYNVGANLNRVKYGTRYREALLTLKQSAGIDWVPDNSWSVGLSAEHLMKEIRNDDYNHIILMGLSGQYKSGRHVLKLVVSNLFNQREYRFSLYDGAKLYSSSYRLRGFCGLISYRYYF